MAFKDILLTLTSYPEPTPISVIEEALSFAESIDSHIAAVACETRVQVPGHFGFIPTSVINIGGMIAAEAHKSLKNAQDLLAKFGGIAEKHHISYEKILDRCFTYEVPDVFVQYARFRDLTIVSVPESYEQWYAEAVIFGSGKPTLVLPERKQSHPFQANTVIVAWDFSCTAARSVADAIPILEKAKHVRIVTVINEKIIDSKRSAVELAKNLSRHNVDVVLDEIDADGRSIGEVLNSYTHSHNADLLVMGAYGHSRFREVILGGATKSMISKPPLPILFSH